MSKSANENGYEDTEQDTFERGEKKAHEPTVWVCGTVEKSVPVN